MADRRMGVWGTDTAIPNALSTSNKRKAAMKDIMSSMSKRLEIKRFVKDVLRSRVDYATRGDLDFSKDDLVSHGFGAFDQYWAPEAVNAPGDAWK